MWFKEESCGEGCTQTWLPAALAADAEAEGAPAGSPNVFPQGLVGYPLSLLQGLLREHLLRGLS